jgi:adenine deaminase
LPESWDVSDSYAVKHIPLSEMMHWEAAACNAAAMFKAGVPFAFSASGLNDIGQTMEMLQKSVKAGLPAKEALRALTSTPAKMIAADNRIGQIKLGMEASFFLTNDTLFHPGNRIVQTWVQGIQYDNEPYQTNDIRGKWNVLAEGFPNMELNISQTTPRAEGQINIGKKEAKSTIKLSGTRIDISVSHPDLQ